MKLKAVIKNNYKHVLLVWAAFFIMTEASYLYVSSVVKKQIDLYSHKEVKVYQNSLKYLIQANEDALIHAAAMMSMALSRGAPNAERLEVLKTLNGVFSSQSDIKDVFMSVYGFIDGDFIDGSGMVPGAFFNPKTAAWLRGAMLTDGIHQTEPYIDPRTNKVVSALSMVVYDQKGESRGVMAVDFLFEPIIDRVSGYTVGEAGFGFLVNKSHKVMAHPNRSLVGKLFEEMPGLAEFKGILDTLEEDIDIKQFDLDGDDYIGFFSRLDNGWYMGNVARMSFYYNQVFSLLPAISAIGLVLALVLSVVLLRLNQAKKLSEEESRSKSSFLARISHEIRTPMNAIIGFSELADRNYGQTQVHDYIKEIRRAGQLLLSLINDILDYSKIESGKFRVASVDYHIGRLLGDVMAIISLKAAEKNLKLETQIDPNLPRELRGDDRAIRQVLLNLLSNAMKYTPSGFVKLSASGVLTGENAIRLLFTVEDSGVGISQEDQGRLFGDFIRLSRDRTASEVEGTGLGLAIAKNLCRLMSGDIEVESELGQGSKFTASLVQTIVDPRPFEALSDLSSIVNLDTPPSVFRTEGVRVMVVDDVSTNLSVASGLLAPYGMEIVTCLSGAEAIERVGQKRFDLFFIDHMMPDMDGVETLKRIRALADQQKSALDKSALDKYAATKNTPAIALTANAMTGVMEMLLAQGFDDYLSKPIDTEKLHQALKKWIKPGLRKTINDDREKGGQDSDLLLALGKVGINTEVCLKNCGEKEDGCRLTLRAFLKDAEHFYWRLTQSAASLDLKDLAISAHAIKSAAANIGALKLSDVAKELEASFKANQTQAVSDGLFGAFLQSLCDLADRLRTVLDAGMAEGSGDSQFRGHFKSVEIGSDIEKLREALKANDVNSADRLVEELGKKADEKLKAILDEVSYQILVSDYQAALKLIANL